MAIRRVFNGRAYGLRNSLQSLAPQPIVANRAPTANDNAPLGTSWLDQANEDAYILVKVDSSGALWTTAPAGGATVVASLQVTGAGGITVDIGDIDVTLGDVNIDAGNLTVTSGITTVEDLVVQGDFDLSSADLIDLTSTLDAAPSIYLHANGGTSEQILLHSDQGTSVDSVSLLSDVGGITLRSTGLATADAINLEAAAGGIDVDAALQLNLASSQNAASAIVITASAGGIDVTAAGAAGEDIDIVNTAGSINLNSGEVIADSMVFTSAGGLDMTVAGTGGLDIDMVNTSGSINITAGQNAADSIVITSSLGGIDILAAGASAGEDIDIVATGSSVNIESTENAALAVYLHANGGTSETIRVRADQGTGAASIDLLSDVGGITLTAGLASADAINLVTSDVGGGIDIDSGTAGFIVDTTGAFSIDGAAASNITTTGAGIDLTLSSVLGSVLVESTEDAALAIRLHANGGTSETIQIHSDQGTGVGSVNLLSDVGGLTLRATGLASADAINLEAVAGGIDADAALQINITSSQDAADALRLLASAGGIDIDAVGEAGQDIVITNTGGSISVVATESAADSIVINSTAGGIDILASGAAAGEDIDIIATGSSVNIQATEAVASAITINASDAAGGIVVSAGSNGLSATATGGNVALATTGTGDIILDSDDTMLLDADGVLELNSSAGAISIGNDANAQAINIGTAGVRPIQVGNASAGTTLTLLGPDNIGITLQNSIRIMTGSGSPNGAVTAPAGSLWLRTDPAGATSRIYVNTDSGTTWTNVTCAA